MRYAIQLTELPNGKIKARCADLEGTAVDDFASKDEAMAFMCGGIPAMMYLNYRRLGKPIPLPEETGDCYVDVPIKVQAKVLLWNYMVHNGIKTAELARRLGTTQVSASRLTDMSKNKASTDAIEGALKALGYHFDLQMIKD